MKIFGITVLILAPLVFICLGMDILMGFDLDNSIKHAFNPFLVKDPAEFILFLILLVFLCSASFIGKKEKEQGQRTTMMLQFRC
ncbi:hypothetical protein KEH51_20305 [[Brevibacterium] frigoritolerans]|uniref:Uncharacterized protein n=1 Tax=Peribacillus frigoritolerans TaxID=450367 RepID=A0A941FL93_9BACI|nr:hypothetical protein [Peribacillus frigoritolerans]